MSAEQILGIVSIVLAVIVVVQSFYVQRSVPVDQVNKLIEQLRPLVDRTVTPVDDELLALLEDLLVTLQRREGEARSDG